MIRAVSAGGHAGSVCGTVGAGIGCGLVVHGQEVAGAHGVAGEIGHVAIDPAGPKCRCGNRGCVEAIAADAAILDRVRETTGAEVAGTAEAIDLAHQGHPGVREVYAAAGEAIGQRRAAVVCAGRGAGQQGGGDEVPHHPVGGGVPQQAVARAEVRVQAERLQVLQHDTPWPCTMPLGRPVVPEENTTHSGWSNRTGVQASSSGRAATSFHGTTREG